MYRKCMLLAVSAAALALAPAALGKALRVGTYKGVRGQYATIQAAVDHARPGDWVLVAPGDYKTLTMRAPRAAPDAPAAVLIQTPHLRLRGMNRGGVIVDGTRRGPSCNRVKADQSFGPGSPASGVNGVMVWKAADVWIENLTTCNFLAGAGDAGNGFWWNGGDGSGRVGAHDFYGSYLTSTSTYFDPANPQAAAARGIVSSNWTRGMWKQIYVSNFSDAGFSIAACQQVCDQVLNHVWAEYNALGYSGMNSGGWLVVENSEFDNNEEGFDTNSGNAQGPSPQNGACPPGVKPSVAGAAGCWAFMDNYVHDNNNPDVPTTAAMPPVGTGMSISGGRFDTILGNRFVHNGAWGVTLAPAIDSGRPCTGGTRSGSFCFFDEWGDALLGNTFTSNGFFGNATNGDFAQVNAEAAPTDCYAGNRDTAGPLTQTPSNAQRDYPRCDGHTVPPTSGDPRSDIFLQELECDSETALPGAGGPPCAPTDAYPRRQHVIMHALPGHLATMRDPCAGVPVNPWCPRKRRT